MFGPEDSGFLADGKSTMPSSRGPGAAAKRKVITKKHRAKNNFCKHGHEGHGDLDLSQVADSKTTALVTVPPDHDDHDAPATPSDARPSTPPESQSERPVPERLESSHEYTAAGLDDSPRRAFRGRHRKTPSRQTNSLDMDSSNETTGSPPTFAAVAANGVASEQAQADEKADRWDDTAAEGQEQRAGDFPPLQPTNKDVAEAGDRITGEADDRNGATSAPTFAEVAAKTEDMASTASTGSTVVNATHDSGRGGSLEDPFTDAASPQRSGRNTTEEKQQQDQKADSDDQRPTKRGSHPNKGAREGGLDGAGDGRDQDKKRALKAGGIRFAPWNVPLQRRLQTMAVLWHSITIGCCLALFWFLCAIPLMWPLLFWYLVHLIFSHDGSDGSLRRRSHWLRSMRLWRYFADYFPARLHKTHDLLPTRKYILGYHPHGIISHGAWVAFGTEALGFADLFPGVTNTLVTLESNFRTPLYRDYVLAMGLQSVSKESITNILTRGGRNGEGMGHAVTIVVGGARESLSAQPRTMRLILQSRKGFIKLALRTGADLVPVIAFGENDLYNQLTAEGHPRLHKLQMWILRVAKFTLPFLHGRGIFNYDVGLMPYRRPLNVVVGRPIPVAQAASQDVSAAEVDRLHELYCRQLAELWDKYKDEFAPGREGEMEFLA